MVVLIGIAGGAVGFGAGRLGRFVLCSARRGVRPPRLWCEVSVCLLWTVVAVRAATGMPLWWVAIPLLLGWLSVMLTVCDVLAARLPDALTLPAYPVAAALLAIAAPHQPGVLVGAVGGVVLFAGTYLLVRVVSPNAMGPGDVKLAGSLGAVVGAVSLSAVLVVMAAAAALTLVASLWARSGGIPHGPAMLAPAWLVTVFASWP
ncbi:prepilin peptidase [Saccharopolyspora phatthalungensis]|uniref:Leader peptidase (Prepilin peptidase)/N-methyltransferase n=1 Tax=Saccharopolyspora phatthalungensis TaxID=664693 RepID=A0A840Q1X4_9PSEU|nr:prepilin peptidase [Saccharopolyspora phatthalungensis]MBB5152778.1 leader peptidase (prepilin peptidase)/N-methyltransferase [Saccharopolyspora phatthalungensis]